MPNRLSASSAWPAAVAQLLLQLGRLDGQDAGELHHELPATAQHGQRRIDEDRGRLVDRLTRRFEKRRNGPDPLERRGRTAGGLAVLSAQNGVEALEEVIDPEDRVPLVRALVLQPEDGGSAARRAAPFGRPRPGDRPRRAPRPRPPPTGAPPRARARCPESNRPRRASCATRPAELAAAGSKWYLRSR